MERNEILKADDWFEALGEICAAEEREMAEKFAAEKAELKQKLFTVEHEFFSKEAYTSDMEAFVEGLEQEDLLGTKLPFYIVNKKSAFDFNTKSKGINGVDYWIRLETTDAGKRVLKLWIKDLPGRIKHHIYEKVGVKLSDEAAMLLYQNLDADGKLKVNVLTAMAFRSLAENVGKENVVYMGAGPQVHGLLILGLISRGELNMFSSETKNKEKLEFSFDAKC